MSEVEYPIDLRSDTVTKPSQAMRDAMAAAPVGDDQFGEDPTMNLLQERIASMLGKEAALWFPSGTMSNQVAIKLFTQPGDDVIVSRESHAVWHETGAAAANSGVQFTEIGTGGLFTVDEFRDAIKPQGHIILPPTTLVEIENSQNRNGGIIFPQNQAEAICTLARESSIGTFLDGARLWNVSVATGTSMADLAAPFDVVGVALSKGLGAPGGTLLAGSADMIKKAVRYRRMLGGAMRQVGIFAAAGLYALDNNIERLAEDNANCRLMGEKLAASVRVILDIDTVETNILVFELSNDAPDSGTVVNKAREAGVLTFAFGPRKVRAVTHLDVTREQCERAADILVEIVKG